MSILKLIPKVCILFYFMLFIHVFSFGQNSVGIGTLNPSSSYMMHVVGQSAKSGLLIQTNGTGQYGLQILQDNNAAGSALRIFNNASNSTPAVEIQQQGTGDALVITKSGQGGSVANFYNSNSTNNGSAVFSATNAPEGYGLGVSNYGNGNAFALWGGGMRVTQLTLSSGTVINSRAVAYLISGGGPYTINYPLNSGETFYFFNSTTSPVNVGSITIPAGAGKVCIVMDGILRGF